MSKRIISIALTVIMLAALLPAAFISASAADDLPLRYQATYCFYDGALPVPTYTRLGNLTFENTLGLMEYAGGSEGVGGSVISDYVLRQGSSFCSFDRSSPNWFALNINVPETSDYIFSFEFRRDSGAGDSGGAGAISSIYAIPAEVKLTEENVIDYTGENSEYFVGKANFYTASKGTNVSTGDINSEAIRLNKGVNTIIFYAKDLPTEYYAEDETNRGTYIQNIRTMKIVTIADENHSASFGNGYVGIVTQKNLPYDPDLSTQVEFREGNYAVYTMSEQWNRPAKMYPTVPVETSWYSTDWAADDTSAIKQNSARMSAEKANAATNVTVASLSGYTSATHSASILSAEVNTTEVELAEAFYNYDPAQGNNYYEKTTSSVANYKLSDVDYYFANKDGSHLSSRIARVRADEETGTVTLSAPEQQPVYGEFLYWISGLSGYKKILSTEPTFTYQLNGGSGRHYLIAVYGGKDGTASANERADFYNADGQYIETKTAVEGKIELPDYPTMYGKTAIGWVSTVAPTSIITEEDLFKKDDEVTLGGEPWTFVAYYGEDKLVNDCTVTVEGSTDDGEFVKAFGEEVTVTAGAQDGEVFKYWKKNDEIVSLDKTYSFFAWEDCTLEAVFGETAPLFKGAAVRILIDTFGNDSKNVMAEFIGIDDLFVYEKGIEVNGVRYKSATSSKQMTLYIDDEGLDYTDAIGYVIFNDGHKDKLETTGTAE